jgi:hypothetical protein
MFVVTNVAHRHRQHGEREAPWPNHQVEVQYGLLHHRQIPSRTSALLHHARRRRPRKCLNMYSSGSSLISYRPCPTPTISSCAVKKSFPARSVSMTRPCLLRRCARRGLTPRAWMATLTASGLAAHPTPVAASGSSACSCYSSSLRTFDTRACSRAIRSAWSLEGTSTASVRMMRGWSILIVHKMRQCTYESQTPT